MANGGKGRQDGQAYISQSPMDITISNPQAVGGTRDLPSPIPGSHNQTEDRHWETLHQRRYPARAGRHETHVHQAMRRKVEHRDQTVNKVRGPALEEAAQQVREEVKEAQRETACPSPKQVDPSPFQEAPASDTITTNKAEGETSEMDLQ